VQRQHYHYALDNPLFPNENWNLPALTYELVDGELDIFPEIRVVPTPGHAPGHQSVLMRLGPSRNFVLCGDAILCRENLDRHLWSGQADPETAQRTGSLLVDLARQEEALLVFGHDPSQWRQLKRAPDFYEEDGRLSG
jgi:N-acyl homoserine lactone hydrolase